MRKLYRRAYIGHTSTDHHSGIQKGGQHRSVTFSQVAHELMQQSTNLLLGQNECAPWLQSELVVGWYVLTAGLYLIGVRLQYCLAHLISDSSV